MPAHTHLAYRRNAQAAAQNHKVRKRDDEDLLLKAREDFAFFCEYIDEKKKPAKHHLEWHRHLVTNQDSDCLLKIAGPNLDLLASRREFGQKHRAWVYLRHGQLVYIQLPKNHFRFFICLTQLILHVPSRQPSNALLKANATKMFSHRYVFSRT
jgi:hypothetical protein